MPEEVVIKVKQESQGTALSDAAAKMEQLKTRIAELNQLEKAYGEKGITSAVTDVKRERAPLERELRTLQQDQTRAVKDRHLAEQAITREGREQAAVAAARRRALTGGLGQGVQAFESASGAGGLGGVTSMLRNPIALVATAVGTWLGAKMSETLEKAMDVQLSQQAGVRSDRRTARTIGRGNALEGEREATGQYQSNRAALEEAQDKKGTFVNTQPIRDFFRSMVNLETTGEAGERKNQLDIDRLQKRSAADKALAEDKFMKGSGGAEMEMKKALLNYDMRSVRAIQDKVTGMKEYDRVFSATGNKELASGAANDAVGLQQRERAGKLGGLINARDGAKDVARVAAVARDMMGGQTPWSELHGIHATMKQQGAEVARGGLRDFEERRRR